jgi:hypothetical protein
MGSKHTIEPDRLTVALTSCGRFDLLETTLASFLAHFEAPRIFVSEDSERPEQAAAFACKHPEVEMCVNSAKLGQMRSIDALYASLRTPYVLHLEDDWFFTRGVPLDSVVDLLEARTDISVVCIGYRFDKRFAHKVQKITHSGVEFLIWDVDTHPKWFSFSLNPSVGRVALWRQIGPFAKFQTEENISAYCKARGMRIAMVNPSCAYHIGEKRHAHDPFQPRRATTLLSRLRRSAAKRWPLAASERSTWR